MPRLNWLAVAAASGLLAACATVPADRAQAPAAEAVQILAINDFHGSLEAPTATTTCISPWAW